MATDRVKRAKQKANYEYAKNNYDRIEIRVSKGRKAILQVHATRRGESLNAFCNRAIDNQLLRDD